MRMRKKKNGAQRLAACSEFLVAERDTPISSSSEIFSRDGELHLEIGCGKGDFVKGMAEKNPDVNFIAVEKATDIIVLALEKINKKEERVKQAYRDGIDSLEEYKENKEILKLFVF